MPLWARSEQFKGAKAFALKNNHELQMDEMYCYPIVISLDETYKVPV